MNKLSRKSLAARFALGPLVIVALFYFAENQRPFIDVWKPLLLYYALALPAFFVVEYFRKRAS